MVDGARQMSAGPKDQVVMQLHAVLYVDCGQFWADCVNGGE